jgi:hypothetical protein
MVAAVLVNTEAMLAELPKKNAPAAGMPPGRWHVWGACGFAITIATFLIASGLSIKVGHWPN